MWASEYLQTIGNTNVCVNLSVSHVLSEMPCTTWSSAVVYHPAPHQKFLYWIRGMQFISVLSTTFPASCQQAVGTTYSATMQDALSSSCSLGSCERWLYTKCGWPNLGWKAFHFIRWPQICFTLVLISQMWVIHCHCAFCEDRSHKEGRTQPIFSSFLACKGIIQTKAISPSHRTFLCSDRVC